MMRKTSGLPEGIQAAIASHPCADVIGDGRCMTNGDIVRQIIVRTKAFQTLDHEAVHQLMSVVATGRQPNGGLSQMTIGGIPIYADRREVTIKRRYVLSGRFPGLFAPKDVPLDETAHDEALAIVNAALKECGSTLFASATRVHARSRSVLDRTTEIEVPAPEEPGETYTVSAVFAHRTDDERRSVAASIARVIAGRDANKESVATQRTWIGAEIYEALKRHEGVEMVGTGFSVDTTANNGVFSGRAYGLIRLMGDNLEYQDVRINDPRQFPGSDVASLIKHHMTLHRANLRRASRGVGVTIDILLAKWAALVPVEYLADIIEEIETAAAGHAMRPRSYRKRGISNISLIRGVVRATVQPARGLTYRDGRLHVRRGGPAKAGQPMEDRRAPATLIAAMPGKMATEVVGHPSLAGLTIKTASTDKRGVFLRFSEETANLADTIAALRKRLTEQGTPS